MTYRDELVAAQNRSSALERELGEMRRQLMAAKGASPKASWSRLMKRGAHAEKRAQQEAHRASQRALIAKRRGEVFDARYRRFESKRRRVRSMTAWGMAAHWLTPMLLLAPLIFFLPLFLMVPAARTFLMYWLAGSAGLYVLSNIWGMFLAGREPERVKALPFAVHGHERALAEEHRELKVCLDFVDVAPRSGQMKTWLRGVAAETRGRPFLASSIQRTKAEGQGANTIVLTPDEVVTGWMRGNRSYLCWYRRVIERAATELHESFPIRSVRID
jgi:hypothetical protein